MFSIRPLTHADLDLVCRHREEMFRASRGDIPALARMREPFRAWVAPRLIDGRYFGWAAEKDGVAVGGLGMMVIDWPPHPNHPEDCRRGYILNVYVEPECRGKGIATRLMKAADAEARARGLAFAVLHPTQAARPLYERLGWQEMAELGYDFEQPFPGGM
jgi:GNAT superfamily N-acetyltransferase